MLTAQGTAGGGYVASERIEGTPVGRHGTFVIQHGGLADGPDQSSYGSIVPSSGTEGLGFRVLQWELLDLHVGHDAGQPVGTPVGEPERAAASQPWLHRPGNRTNLLYA